MKSNVLGISWTQVFARPDGASVTAAHTTPCTHLHTHRCSHATPYTLNHPTYPPPPPPRHVAQAYSAIVTEIMRRDPDGAVLAFADMMKKVGGGGGVVDTSPN